jgi:phenylacetate-CoA ligase
MLDLRRGTNSLQRLEELKKSQWLKRDEIRKMQSQKLKSVISHAYENVPYYHRTFKELNLKPEDIKSQDDLKKLPIIDKKIIRKNFEDFKAKDFQNHTPILRTTGGTTGEPLKYYSDRNEHGVFWADLWRAWNLAGYELGERRATLGGTLPSSSRTKVRSFISSRLMERNISLSSFEVNRESMQMHVKMLRNYRPKILRGYPSALYLFAKYLEERKIKDLNIKGIISISEQLYDHQRKAIENAFGCQVFNNYGCPDGGVLASECKENELHLNSENAIMEIVKGEDVVSPGEEGEMVSTNLVRSAMPFIRYRTGDVGIQSDEKSRCKRGLEMLDEITGRTSDYIVLPNGNLLSGVSIAAVFNAISSQLHIQHYQVLQEKRDELEVLIVEDKGYSEKESEFIKEALQEHIGSQMVINLKQVDDIPLTVGGKRRSVVSKIKVDFA